MFFRLACCSFEQGHEGDECMGVTVSYELNYSYEGEVGVLTRG